MNRTEILAIAKPMLFNTDMVKAILEGRKTVTRRCVKPQFNSCSSCHYIHDNFGYDTIAQNIYCQACGEPQFYDKGKELIAPYQVGDFIYVRETWKVLSMKNFEKRVKFIFKAWGEHDIHEVDVSKDKYKKLLKYECKNGWQPSLFMPKEAARIILKVTDVRIERLQDINGTSLEHEGVKTGITHFKSMFNNFGNADRFDKAIEIFSELWNSTIKKQDLNQYGWDANPFCWVISFERVNVE